MNSGHAVLQGAQRPNHLLLPVNRRKSELSLEALELCELAGLTLDDWQQWFLTESLASGPDGLWAAGECGVVVPRQNGKGDLIMARQLVGLFLLGETLAVHSAHEFKTAFEHFLRIVNVVEGCPDLERDVIRIRRGAGEQAIELKGGQRLRFLARSAGSGRGLSGDTVYLDEAFALTSPMMGALLPTLSARRNPQLWYTSSAPKATSDVLHEVRNRAHRAEAKRLLWAEWAADPNCDPSDVNVWAATNPAFGARISEQSVRMEYEALAVEEFARERLGIPDGVDGGDTVIPLTLWAELVDLKYEMQGKASLALDVAPGGRWSSICAVQVDRTGIAHLEIVDRRISTEWVVDRCLEIQAVSKTPIAYAANGPVVALVPSLEAAGVLLTEVAGGDVTRHTQTFVDTVQNRRLRHRGDEAFKNAIVGAAKRAQGDVWTWGRSSSTADITPLVAATLALCGMPPPRPLWAF